MTRTLPKIIRLLFPWILFTGPGDRRTVYLTFDDGPHPEFTPRVMDILNRHYAPAVFFLTGEKAEQHPRLVREMASRGFTPASHGWTHRKLAWLPRPVIEQSLSATRDLLAGQTGTSPRFFRPPHGRFDPRFRSLLRRLGQTLVLWHLLPGDFRPFTPGALVQRIESAVRPGSIITLHDGHPNAAAMVQELDAVLTRLREQGYTFGDLNAAVSGHREAP